MFRNSINTVHQDCRRLVETQADWYWHKSFSEFPFFSANQTSIPRVQQSYISFLKDKVVLLDYVFSLSRKAFKASVQYSLLKKFQKIRLTPSNNCLPLNSNCSSEVYQINFANDSVHLGWILKKILEEKFAWSNFLRLRVQWFQLLLPVTVNAL